MSVKEEEKQHKERDVNSAKHTSLREHKMKVTAKAQGPEQSDDTLLSVM